MSKPLTSNSTKVFTWSSVASGKKQTQAEIEDARTKEQAKKAEQERALFEKRKEEQLRETLILQNRSKEFAMQNALRFERAAKEEKERQEYFSRERGYWAKEVNIRYENNMSPVTCFDQYRMLEVPLNVNERSMKFIQHMLVNYPEVTSTCKTVGNFKKVFMEAYIQYVKRHYEDTNVNYSSAIFAKLNNTPNETFVEQGENLQGWAAYEEGLYKSSQAELKRTGNGVVPRPPWFDKLWVFVKNVSFTSCLWAMNEKSKTFEMETKTGNNFNTGFVKIIGPPYTDTSLLIWLTDLETYKGFPHKEKPVCKQRREEEERKERERDEDADCW
jgi:hypothetical protein